MTEHLVNKRGATHPWPNAVALGLLAGLLATGAAGSAASADPVIEPEIQQLARGGASPLVLGKFARTESSEAANAVDVWLQGPVDRGAVEALGGRVGAVAGNWTMAHVPVAALDALTRFPGLQRAQLAQGLVLQSDQSVPLIGAPILWGGSAPNYPSTGKTGKRVVIGIVDSGIDFTRPDFRKIGTTKTRILALWDQTWMSGPKPSANYGTEYTAAGIDSGKCYAYDNYVHGTFTAGASCGNGQATGNGKSAYKYVGAAPEADLIVVKMPVGSDGSVLDSHVIDGVSYVFQRAAALHEPAVVIISAGKTTGPHDGHDPLDEAISALTGPGKIVCVAAGNEGGLSHHAEWTSTATGQLGNITFSIPSCPAGPADLVQIEGWYDAGANYSVSLISPSGQMFGPLPRGATLTNADGSISLTNGQYTSDKGSYRVNVQLAGSAAGTAIRAGTWTIRMTSQTAGTQRADFWITCGRMGLPPAFVQGKTEMRLVTSPASADSVIAVGAFTSRPSWTAVNGSTYSFPGAVQGGLASFSSTGPRRDGAVCPHITAPGFGLATTRSAGYYPSTSYLMPDSAHCMTSGTSIAAALTGGCVALLLQDNTTYRPSEVLAVLKARALSDGFTGSVPNAQWGWGKLRINPAVSTDVPLEAPLQFGLKLVSPTTSGPKRFEFAIPASELASSGSVWFRILDVAGRQVWRVPAQMRAGIQVVEWGGRGQADSAGPGVYWARLTVGRKASVLKFISLR
jgi:minor extracellular serine protease Vpr